MSKHKSSNNKRCEAIFLVVAHMLKKMATNSSGLLKIALQMIALKIMETTIKILSYLTESCRHKLETMIQKGLLSNWYKRTDDEQGTLVYLPMYGVIAYTGNSQRHCCMNYIQNGFLNSISCNSILKNLQSMHIFTCYVIARKDTEPATSWSWYSKGQSVCIVVMFIVHLSV